jgi:hypothetical protein
MNEYITVTEARKRLPFRSVDPGNQEYGNDSSFSKKVMFKHRLKNIRANNDMTNKNTTPSSSVNSALKRKSTAGSHLETKSFINKRFK